MQRIALTLTAYVAGAASAALLLQSSSLYINGNLASKSVIQHGGTAYAPIRDIADAMKMSLKKTSRGYELQDSGGSDQLGGQSGKVGETLWNGFMKFQVVKVIRTDDYHSQFLINPREYTSNPSTDLVILVCRMKNGMKTKASVSEVGGHNTGLTDSDEHSYPLKDLDSLNGDAELLPGSAADFALIYEVPKTAEFKDLVYEWAFFYTPISDAQGKMMRISLKEAPRQEH